jgi:DNA modification methylase
MNNLPLNKIIQHNVLDPWPLPDRSVNCIVTSVPYFNQRDYKMGGQIGLEKTPAEYIEKMVRWCREARRVLVNNGTLWINVGDSYASTGKNRSREQATAKSGLQGGLDTQCASLSQQSKISAGLKAKDLIGIPWLLAFALREDGWYLRQDIIWSKPNPMPESVTDRCTRSHEYIFMFSKSKNYFYDHEAIKTPAIEHSLNPSHFSDGTKQDVLIRQRGKTDKQRGHTRRHAGFNERWDNMTTAEQQSMGANRRSVWNIATVGFTEAHFATFPEELPSLCIKAGCPRGG